MKSRVVRIFKKDAAHLWPQILLFLALLALFAYSDPVYYVTHVKGGLMSLVNLLRLVLPLSCWLLVISVIHEETPIGDNQYWLTRPFAWTDLLAAKVLFLLAFVNLPVFLCQSTVLAANGFSPLDHLTDLLAKQVFFSALLVLPAAALAAVTKGLARTILGGVLLWVPLALAGVLLAYLAHGSSWGGLEWIRASGVAAVAICGAVMVILFQYTRRRTVLSRAVLAGAAVLVMLLSAAPPWQPAFGLQSWFSARQIDSQAVRISFDPRPDAPLPANASSPLTLPGMTAPPAGTRLEVPIQVEDIPAGMEVVADWTSVEVEGSGLKPWRSGWVANWGIVREASGKRWLTIFVDADYFDRIKGASVRLQGSVDLTLVVRTQSLPSYRFVEAYVPGLGPCSGAGTERIECLSPLPRVSLTLVSRDSMLAVVGWWALRLNNAGSLFQSAIDRNEVYAPYPTSPWFGPLQRYAVAVTYFRDGPMADSVLAVEHPVAHIQRSFDFHSLRLADYLSTNN
jgi:hypothetical protein